MIDVNDIGIEYMDDLIEKTERLKGIEHYSRYNLREISRLIISFGKVERYLRKVLILDPENKDALKYRDACGIAYSELSDIQDSQEQLPDILHLHNLPYSQPDIFHLHVPKPPSGRIFVVESYTLRPDNPVIWAVKDFEDIMSAFPMDTEKK